MKHNWKQKNEIRIRKNISGLTDELKAFEQRMDERLTDELEKLEKANADILNAQKNAETALNSKSETVILNIEEVKNLLQLLAVNELLDEINAEKAQ